MSTRCKWQEFNTSVTGTTRVWHKQHICNTSATRMTQMWNECDTNNMSATRVKNFDFDNDTSENIFSHHYISCIAYEKLQGEEQSHARSYLFEMLRSHAKMRLKSVPQKLNFVMAKAISKSYTLDHSCKCPCMFPHSCS